jgi:hypothetical protein
MPTVRELRDRTPKGYALAMEVPMDFNQKDKKQMAKAMDDFMTDKACIVLAEAQGDLGLIRALDLPGRRQGIIRAMLHDGEARKFLHLRFLDVPTLEMDLRFYIFKLVPKENL